MNVNYDQLEQAIANYQPYNHGSSHGVITTAASLTPDSTSYRQTYVVYSYDTVILEVNPATGFVYYYNDRKYSMTTSRLQNIIKRTFDIESYLKVSV